MRWSAGCRVASTVLVVATLGAPGNAEAQFKKLKNMVAGKAADEAVQGATGSCFGDRRPTVVASLPLSAEGVAAGFLAVFMQASGALVMPLLLGGQTTMILPVLIWEQFAVANDRHFAAVLALILLSMAMAVLVLQMNLSRSRRLAP